MSIYIEDYTEKSFVVLGETKEHKENLKKLGGKWNSKLRDDKAGWIFMMKDKSIVQDYIDSGKVVNTNINSSTIPTTYYQKQEYQELLEEIKLLRSEMSLLREQFKSISKPQVSQNIQDIDEDDKPRRRLLRS
jgi:hypothetical protein